MSDCPAPLIPPEVDIRGMPGFMLDADRLLASELVALATPEEGWFAFMLWCRAWQQHPPASLPNDERILAAFSRAGPRWKRVREMAMRGFVLCSDDRYYHRVLCEQVMTAWAKRKAYRSDQERLKEWRKNRRANGSETPSETPSETGFTLVSHGVSERDRQGQGQGQGQGQKKENSDLRSAPEAGAAPTIRDTLWRDGPLIVHALIGQSDKQSRTFLGKLLKVSHDDCARVYSALREAESLHPADASAWLIRSCTPTSERGQAALPTPVDPITGQELPGWNL